jgi:Cd2+/Zn2+-exporting ATPase
MKQKSVKKEAHQIAERTPELNARVQGMDCANCALTLERSLGQLEGVDFVQVNFATTNLTARGNFDPAVLERRVEALGYHLAPPAGEKPNEGSTPTTSSPAPAGVAGFVRFLLASRQTAIALLASLLLLLSAVLSLLPGQPWTQTIALALEVAVILGAGAPIANRGVRALLVGRQVTIDLLMSIATLGALLIGESGEAATVIVLFAIGEALEGYTAERARRSLRALLSLRPDQAVALRPCLDCAEHLGQDGYTGGPCPVCGVHPVRLPVEQLQPGETVLVMPGERIPVDGLVLHGSSTVNQAPVTGESLPVFVEPGAQVFAGSLNGDAALEVTVIRLASDSTISRIVRLVEQAQAQKAPIERFIDRFAAWYTPAVVALAALLAIVPPLIFSAPFLDTPDGARGWLYRALALLIIACPCALVISTPVTVVSALTRLAQHGVLVKGGALLDALAGVRVFAFDKTGTLTRGRPVVTQTRTLDCPPEAERCAACDEMLVLAASVESRSTHPLAQAILAEADARRLSHRLVPAENVQSLAGQGVRGHVNPDGQTNGALVTVGRHTLFHNQPFEGCGDLHEQVMAAEASGETVILVGQENTLLGYVSVADTARGSSKQALQQLKAMDPGLRLVMLTGDNPQVARQVAEAIGSVDEIRAGLLPEEKLAAVKSLSEQRGAVAMVGDGINDAPALAAARVGMAMGGAGSAQAMETADIVLMQDDLTHLPQTLRVSRYAQAIIRQNIILSLGIKALFLLLAIPGWTTLWMAVFADMGASLLVTLNGLRVGSDRFS